MANGTELKTAAVCLTAKELAWVKALARKQQRSLSSLFREAMQLPPNRAQGRPKKQAKKGKT